jgi:hypothetical protein
MTLYPVYGINLFWLFCLSILSIAWWNLKVCFWDILSKIGNLIGWRKSQPKGEEAPVKEK